MSTSVTEATTLSAAKQSFMTEEIEYPVAITAIREKGAEVLKLTINGVNDKDGMLAVKKAKISLGKMGTAIEDKRKALNRDALDWQKKVNSVAKVLQDELDIYKDHCKSELDRIEREQEAIEQQEQDKLYEERLETWNQVGGFKVDRYYLLGMTDGEFDLAAQEQAENTARKKKQVEEHEQWLEKQKRDQEELRQQQEQLRQQQEADRVKRDALNSRIRALVVVRATLPPDLDVVAAWSDEEFSTYLKQQTALFEQEEATRKADKERADKLAAEEAARSKALKEEADMIQREADQKAANEQRAKELEEARLRGIQEAEDKRKSEEENRAKTEEAERLYQERQAKLKPSKDRLASYVEAINAVSVPLINDTTDRKITSLRTTFTKAIQRVAAELE